MRKESANKNFYEPKTEYFFVNKTAIFGSFSGEFKCRILVKFSPFWYNNSILVFWRKEEVHYGTKHDSNRI